jgi:hypothetical protein
MLPPLSGETFIAFREPFNTEPDCPFRDNDFAAPTSRDIKLDLFASTCHAIIPEAMSKQTTKVARTFVRILDARNSLK